MDDRSRTEGGPRRPDAPVRHGIRLGGGLLIVGIVAATMGGVVHWSEGADEPVVGIDGIEPPAPGAEDLSPELELPVAINEEVDRWIQRFLTTDRESFEIFLSRESLYGEIIRKELRSRGMPEDLLYLAMIESGFSTRAVSSREATGLWQFMGSTAREYGLRIDGYVDERRDPLRATVAAVDYLEELHDRFGSWYLAAAAYNAGPNRVARTVRLHGERYEGEEEIFWEISDRLPRETRHYVPKLLAATLLARSAEEYGFEVAGLDPYHFERVWVPGETSLVEVARILQAPHSHLRDLNPHLVRGLTPPGTSYPLRIPSGESQLLVAALGPRGVITD